MKRVIILLGLPGSGKSTWARKLIADNPGQYKRIGNDDLREMFDNGRYSRQNEKFMLDIRDSLILQCLDSEFTPIVDATHLNSVHEIRIRELVKDRAEVEVKDFLDVPIDECIKRDLFRVNSVGEKVIRDMHNKYLKASPPEINYKFGLPAAIICDIDGTIALLNGRDPYDASTCDKDQINFPVANILSSFQTPRDFVRVLFVSGREDRHYNRTKKWLYDHLNFAQPFKLFMRGTGDSRKDSIIKEEIYEEHIKGKYNILFVLDDRNQTVEKWRDLGLPTFQVADGDF
jgi:predicted kinase